MISFNTSPPTKADEQEVLAFLKKQKDCQFKDMKFNIESENIGPNKPGLIGSYNFGTSSTGNYYFFEKTSLGLVKRANIDLGMNDYFIPSKKVNKGYYDIIVAGHSASGPFNIIYRCNGDSYLRFKIVE